MKRIMDGLACKPFGGGKFKAVVLDECHMLSKSAWNSLLKDVEEPPKHVYWFFCTTELAKVPKTIKTRCLAFDLKSVSEKDLAALVKYVADKEAIKLPADVSDMICTEAMGSPRQALVNLEACREAKDKKEAATLLKVALEGDSIRELCQFLLKGGSWMKCAGILAKLAEENPESIRIVVCNYMAAVIRNARSDKDACSTLSILQAFSTPYNAAEQMAPLYLSVGQVLFRSE
jgi:DNA polymerase III gamma/tau subunit